MSPYLLQNIFIDKCNDKLYLFDELSPHTQSF